MNKASELYVKQKKEQLIDTLDSGTIKEPIQQYALIDNFVLDILLVHDNKTELEKYLKLQDDLKTKIKDENKKLEKQQKTIAELINEYGNNAREMYEEIKKL